MAKALKAWDGSQWLYVGGGAAAAVASGPEIGVQTDHGAVGDGTTNDAAAIQAAIDEAYTLQGTVVFENSTGGYLYNSTLNFKANRYVGLGNSAILRRGGNFVGITFSGPSVNVGGTRYQLASVHNLFFRGQPLETTGWTADHMQLGPASWVYFTECEWMYAGGRHMLMRELWDSRFLNCRILYGGNTSGTVPAIEMQSETAIPGDPSSRFYGTLNEVHFSDCHFEHYAGRAIENFGTNTNRIYIKDTKFESQTTVPHLKFTDVNAIRIDGMGIHDSVPSAQTVAQVLHITGSTAVKGHLHVSHAPGGGNLTNFVRIENTYDVDLNLQALWGAGGITDTYAVVTDGQDTTHRYTGNVVTGKRVYKHAPPSVAVGAGAGTGATVTVDSTISDRRAGLITLTTGTSTTANSLLFTVTLPSSVDRDRVMVQLTPANSAAAADFWNVYVDTPAASGTAFTVRKGNTALSASAQYQVNYQIVDRY